MPVQAQEERGYDYVDLIVNYEYDSTDVEYRVRNVGTATATGVTVSFLLEDLQTYAFVSSSSITSTNEGTNQRFTWEVGTLPPGGTSTDLTFSTSLHTGLHTVPVNKQVGVVTATASSNQPEPGFLLPNNVAKVYSYASSTTGSTLHMSGNRLGLLLTVDDLRPDAEGNVNFGLTARNLNAEASIIGDYINLIGDIEIRVELSDGLEFKSAGDWTRPTGFTTSGRSATWKPKAVDSKTDPNSHAAFPVLRDITIQTQLTSDSLDDIPREERCIAAWVEDSKPPPNPDYVLGSLRQCLGDDPTVLLRKGSIGLLIPFPCIGTVNRICQDLNGDNASDSKVNVAAAAPLLDETVNLDTHDSVDLDLRSQDIVHRETFRNITNTAFLNPENVIVQVKDPEGRVNDTYATHSLVTSGPSWQTGRKTTSTNTPLAHRLSVPGVLVTYTRKTLAIQPGETSTQWTALNQALSVAKDGKDAQSKIRLRSNSTGKTTSNFPFDLTAPKSLTTTSTSVIPYFFQFSELGTYSITYHANATHSGTVYPPRESGQHRYATGTFTVHVGPIAELEVRDGGASPHAPAGRNALTIFAANNGPDSTLGARVTKLPKGAEVLHISQGSYDGTAGEWDIGELEDSGLLRARGFPGHATLVLNADAGETAKVTIKNSVDYTVCIGSDASTLAHTTKAVCEAVTGASWHEGTVYDYNDGNNTAKITAAKGTGGVGPGIPGSLRTQTGTTAVTWDPARYLYGLPVECYEVQGLDTVWTTLAGCVAGNQYVDDEPAGRRGYRVRAFNMAGVDGPWSSTSMQVRDPAQEQAGLAGPPLNLFAQADGNYAIDLSWDRPEDQGGSAITGYTVQWSPDASEDSWKDAGSTSASVREFKHRGLQIGTTRYYRVAARNNSGLGPWSYSARGETEAGVPDAPTLRATTLSDYEIELTWNEPRDNGRDITGYQIERSDDGSADSWYRLASTGALAYTDSALSSNTRRYYRVRAVNSAGDGVWSRTVSAVTHIAPPLAPSLTGAEADGPNAIVVAWDEPYVYDGVAITQYEVSWARNPDAETWRNSRKFSASTRSWRHTGLKPDETWYYRVRASNGGNRWSYWSYIQSATTASEAVPSTEPGGLTAQYDSAERSVKLTWSALSGKAITGYDLQYSGRYESSEWDILATTGPEELTYTDSGHHLYPGAVISYRVRAVTNEGEGPWSRSVRVSVPPEPPDAPRLMWVEGDGSNQIVLGWEPPYHDGGADITGYRLLWCRELDDPAVENPCAVAPEDQSDPLADPPGYSAISIGASAVSYTHSVSPGYYYHYLLRATNGGNRWSEWRKNDISYAITHAGSPSAPVLTARAVDSSQIKLTWTKPNDYGSEINSYWLYVYRENERLNDWDNILDVVTVPGDETEYTLDGLSPGTTRYFRIRAWNANGTGKYSALKHATTPAE